MKYTVCIGEFTETYEGTVEEIVKLKNQTKLTSSTSAKTKNTPYLDELYKGLNTYFHRGRVPCSIEMNPVYFGELSIETINSSVISSGPELGDIRFKGIPIKINSRIDSYSIN